MVICLYCLGRIEKVLAKKWGGRFFCSQACIDAEEDLRRRLKPQKRKKGTSSSRMGCSPGVSEIRYNG